MGARDGQVARGAGAGRAHAAQVERGGAPLARVLPDGVGCADAARAADSSKEVHSSSCKGKHLLPLECIRVAVYASASTLVRARARAGADNSHTVQRVVSCKAPVATP